MEEQKEKVSFFDKAAGSFKGIVDSVLTAFEKLKNISRSNVEMGILQMRMGNFYDARLRFKIALKFDKNNVIAHYLLGKTYIYEGKYESAVAPLKRTLELDPNFAEAGFLLKLTGHGGDLHEIPRSFVIDRNDTIADNYARIYPDDEPTKAARKLQEEFNRYFENWQGFTVIDLGCQGGEFGVLLKNKANVLVGVEPSIKLAGIARLKRLGEYLVYNKISGRFPEDYLRDTEEKFQVMLSVLYLSNFAELEWFFKLARAKFVENGGVFIFTISPSDTGQNYFQAEKILFRHTEQYVEQCLTAAGFKVQRKTEVVYESGFTDLLYITETV